MKLPEGSGSALVVNESAHGDLRNRLIRESLACRRSLVDVWLKLDLYQLGINRWWKRNNQWPLCKIYQSEMSKVLEFLLPQDLLFFTRAAVVLSPKIHWWSLLREPRASQVWLVAFNGVQAWKWGGDPKWSTRTIATVHMYIYHIYI